MRVEVAGSFFKDLEILADAKVRRKALDVALTIQSAETPHEIPNFKKLKGAPNAFRIRIGSYRIAAVLESETMTLLRCLPRRDFYRVFP